MKEITFAELKNFNDSNSSVIVGVTPDCTPEEIDDFFHEAGFYNDDQHWKRRQVRYSCCTFWWSAGKPNGSS